MLELVETHKHDPAIKEDRAVHYSQPKGFVGRNICYLIYDEKGDRYGSIAGGSATRFLPGRNEFFSLVNLNEVINNIFFHVRPVHEKYPFRNFTNQVLRLFREKIAVRWKEKYGDNVVGFETLVEKPRTGEVYYRDGWTLVGETVGYTCKRTGGQGTDSWTGKRVWDTVNLRPKLVFCKHI